MKKILITGENSYIGNSLETWLLKEPDKFEIDKISLKDDDWKNYDFSQYDSLVHVAGIAHNSSKAKMKELYYTINRDLTIEVAKEAKEQGVKQFIFMSSIIVYGDQYEVIDENTKPSPANFYGDSKLQAENGIKKLESEDFKVVIIRPPMVYGKGSKGNYPKLAKFAKITPIFPNIDNQRSMLHIDNLTEFIKLTIKNENTGIFHPQNKDYVNTSQLVKAISQEHGRKVIMIRMPKNLTKSVCKINLFNKVFGNLIYKKTISNYSNIDYTVKDFKHSIKDTEIII